MTKPSSTKVAVLVFAAALFAQGCGDSSTTPGKPAAIAPPAPTAMQNLVPEGTVGIVHIPNLKAFEDDVNRLVKAAEPTAPAVKVGDAAQEAGVEPGDIDLSRGAILAMTMAAGAQEPGITAVIPVRDAKATAAKVKSTNPGAVVDTEGDYAAVTIKGGAKRGGMPAKLGAALPEADVVVRLDMATLGKTFAPMLMAEAEQGLEAVGEAAASVKPMLDGLKSVIDGSSMWTIALRIDGGAVEVDVVMDFASGERATLPGFFKKSDLSALAKSIPEGGMFQMACSLDAERMIGALRDLMTASLAIYPEEQRAALKKLFETGTAATKHMGGGMAGTGSFGPDGMDIVMVIESPNPAEYMKVMTDMIGSADLKGTFMTVSPIEERTVEETKVRSFRLTMDASKMGEAAKTDLVESMWGKDGLHYNFAALGNRVLVSIGKDEILTRALKAAKSSSGTALSKAIAAAGPDTVGYVGIDMRAVMRFSVGVMAGITGGGKPKTPLAAGDPVPLTIALNAAPARLRTRISLDWIKLMNVMEEMKPK
jgi:hypothetical protein